MVTAPDFSVPHTQFGVFGKKTFGLYYPSSRVDNAQKYKKLRHWSALIKIVPHWIFFLISYTKTWNQSWSNPEK